MFKKSIYLIISILILFPYPLDINVMGYPFSTSYLLMILVFLFLPVALLKRNYWNLPFTKLIWSMRLIFIAIFLMASFKFGLSSGRIFSFTGYFMISFLYEITFIFEIETKKFFKVFNGVFLFVLIYATFTIGYFVVLNGSLLYSIHDIRDFLFLYPNHFAILLILIYWIRQYFIEKHSKIVDIWIIILIFISLSRAAIATFMVTFIVSRLMSDNYNKRKKTVSIVLVLSLLIPASFYLMELKEQSAGSMLERTYYSRTARWETALDTIKQSPVIGTGFDRTTTVVSNYRSISGQQAELGSMHNDYIDLLLKGGILGLASFLAVLICIIVLGVRHNKSSVILALTIMLTAFFQNPMKNVTIMFFLYFPAGVMLVSRDYNYLRTKRRKIRFKT